MYPRASGNGITANALMYEICKMAGLYDIGLKIHGSRNVRNAGERRSGARFDEWLMQMGLWARQLGPLCFACFA
jgi:hypothetical protein